MLVGKRLASQIDPLVATWLGYTFSIVFLAGMLIAEGGWPKVTPLFFVLMAISGCFDATSKLCIMNALRRTQLSIISPVDSFTPLFAVAAAFLFLHQRPSLIDLVGILLIVVGAYGLNVETNRRRWFEPIRRLMFDRGVQLMMVACVIQGVAPIVQTRGIRETFPVTPLAASVVSFSVLSVMLAPFAWQRMRKSKKVRSKHVATALLFGAIASVLTYAGWKAFTLTNPSYVVAVGRMSILFGMIWGAWLLKERVTAIRFGAGATMLVGVVLLALQ
jgi:drug/metabolite transporter (DMT)-like permease